MLTGDKLTGVRPSVSLPSVKRISARQWLVYQDLWSKRMIFSDMVSGKDIDLTAETQRHGPVNMLESLENPFSKAQLKALRVQMGKSEEGTDGQLRKWLFRKFITYSNQTGMYTKTEEYLKNVKM